jgi:predicted nucleic-acid-binding protein
VIGLDTNVLVRYLTQDDPDQAARATALIESLDEDDPGYISIVALIELHWILRRAYQVSRGEVAAIMHKLLEARELLLEEPEVIRRALTSLDDGTDFPDAVISESGAAAGCSGTATFDRRASRLKAMFLVPELAASTATLSQ